MLPCMSPQKKQREKGVKKRERNRKRELETKTETGRFSYRTGQLCVRLAYWITSPTNYCTQHIRTNIHILYVHALTLTPIQPLTSLHTHTYRSTLAQQLQVLQQTVLIAPITV